MAPNFVIISIFLILPPIFGQEDATTMVDVKDSNKCPYSDLTCGLMNSFSFLSTIFVGPKNPNPCEMGQFKCYLDGKCIEMSEYCNGVLNCKFGEDEVECSQTCREGLQFDCTNSTNLADFAQSENEKSTKFNTMPLLPIPGLYYPKKCIPLSEKCDGISQCPNGSDEENCEMKIYRCERDQFQCGDRSCISCDYLCDGQYDCPYFEDEGACGTPDQPECDNSTVEFTHNNPNQMNQESFGNEENSENEENEENRELWETPSNVYGGNTEDGGNSENPENQENSENFENTDNTENYDNSDN